MQECKISIIVPIYNVEEYLRKCLDSIINQTYTNIEIILVDDGSTDNSGKIAEEYANLDDRIFLIHKPNGGLSDARNVGLDNATGDYIGFVDSDDWIELDMYQCLYQSIVRVKADVSICCYRKVLDGQFINDVNSKNDFVCSGIEALKDVLIGERDYQFCLAVWNKLYRREIIEKERFPVSKCYEDIMFTTKVLYSCEKCVCIDSYKYNYVIKRIGSITYKPFNVKSITDQLPQFLDRVIYLKEKGETELVNISLLIYFFSLLDNHEQIRYCSWNDKDKLIADIESRIREIINEVRKLKLTKKQRIMIALYNINPKVCDYVITLNKKVKKEEAIKMFKIIKHMARYIYIRLRRIATAEENKIVNQFINDGGETLRVEYDLKETSIVFDLGGYKGDFAAEIFVRYQSTIYVFEPVEEFYNKVCKRFQMNKKIKCYKFGLSNKDDKLVINKSQDASSIYSKNSNYGECEQIELKDIVQFIKSNNINNIDLMKINVEGSEYEILETLIDKSLIENIDNIQVQFHDNIPNARERMSEIKKALTGTHKLTYEYEFVWENWKRK